VAHFSGITPPKEELLFEIAGARFFTGWIPFPSPNQPCQNTEGIMQIQNKKT